MHFLQLYQLFVMLSTVLMMTAIGCGGYLLFPHIGLTVFPLGMLIVMIFAFMDTFLYVMLHKATHDLNQLKK